MRHLLILALIGLTSFVISNRFAKQRDPILESQALLEMGITQSLEGVYFSTGTTVVGVRI